MPPRNGPPQILLLGRNGQIGWDLHRALAVLGPVTAIDYPDVDLANRDSIRQWIETVRPGLIVNAAAYTAIDEAESDLERAMAINGNAPALLAELARRHDALLVHFSTAYVYDGAKNAAYIESDPTNPINIYGQTKLVADQAIASSGCRHLILRTSWIYGLRGRNFLHTILRAGNQSAPLRIAHDELGNPSPSRLIAEATAHILVRLYERKRYDIRELYHLAADGHATWHEFANAILTRVESPRHPHPNIEGILPGAEPPAARRPARTVLNTDRIQSDFSIVLPHWESALVQVLDELKAYAPPQLIETPA